ncbi:MAG TPA: family 1 glycosylhydrolase [Burkholderiaceae bacterium]|nr:family 1 glycosylhydrolase [Burkholderiaceae bacterium]
MHAQPSRSPIALWIGPEPTVNRVGDRYFDQLEATGFAHRLDDIDRLASLGAERVRFPVLWERAAPHGGEAFDWRWTDSRLKRLRECGLKPIAGLVHHGSGPSDTSLLDPRFPEKLARYARAVAERYPWIDAWTPINEPLTTARFAGLYGIWHPHGNDERAFLRVLMNELRATVLAMRAVRDIIPHAQLVQTDDLGHVESTPPLRYQADFENARRWLGYDALCGLVDDHHPLRKHLRASGITQAELQAFVDEPCPPDIVGINTYATSERFLDHRLDRYSKELHGGNGQHAYADIEKVRVMGRSIGGFEARLREAWQRYQRPVAITEAHLGCTREEQMRWLLEAWRAAERVAKEGADVRAVTVWSAFGAHSWNCLLTRPGHYESGVWDVRGPDASTTSAEAFEHSVRRRQQPSHEIARATPRETALATLARQLARGEKPNHPVLTGCGWWRRHDRLHHPAHGRVYGRTVKGRPVLIIGATGTLGRACARLCALRGLPYRLLSRDELDIALPASIDAALKRWRPWAVINTAGFVRVDDAEHDPRHWRENAEGPALLAQACATRKVQLLTFSTDLVFDGEQQRPYVESDTPRPLNAYGASKHAAEQRVLEAMPDALVIRTAAFFGPWDRHNFVTASLERLRRGHAWHAADDQVVSPTYVPDLVTASIDLLIDADGGCWHLVNQGAVSWAELARLAARRAKLNVDLVEGVSGATLGQVARRPAYSALSSERALIMPTLDAGLDRYFREVMQGVLEPLEERAEMSVPQARALEDADEALEKKRAA